MINLIGCITVFILGLLLSTLESIEDKEVKIRPLYDQVVVRRLDAETTTKTGIIIPDSATEKPNQGEIVAVGKGALTDKGELRALAVKVGDRILFGKYSGTEIKIDNEELLVMKESDILAIVEPQNDQESAT